MHGSTNLHGGDLNKHCNLHVKKVLMHGHNILVGGDINGNEKFREQKLFTPIGVCNIKLNDFVQKMKTLKFYKIL